MKDVIELLLNKQATLEADKEAEKALACEKIDAEYAERADKIADLLNRAGYIPPIVEETDEQADEQAETETVEEAVETVAAVAENAAVNEQKVY